MPRRTEDGFLPAETTASPDAMGHRASYWARRLATSLACYCSDDDVGLSRDAFLEMVRDRIDMDLETQDF